MKKFTKFCLALSLLLITAGSTLCIVAFSQGFRFSDLSKATQNRFGLVAFYDDRDGEEHGSYESKTREVSSNEKESSSFDDIDNEVENLDIELGFGSVYLLPSNTDSIQLEILYEKGFFKGKDKRINKVEYRFDNEDKTLKITDNSDDKEFFEELFSLNNSVVINLYIPTNYAFKDIEIETGAASVSVEDVSVKAENIDIEIGAGELVSNEESALVAAEKLDLSVGAGQIGMAGVIQAKELEMDSGVGSVEFYGLTDVVNTKINCGVGSVFVAAMSGDDDEYNFDIESGIGSISIDDSNISGLGSDKKINNDHAKRKIVIRGGMGSVEVNFEYGERQ
jgi:hypothetical protein